jgi:hypothetical protein
MAQAASTQEETQSVATAATHPRIRPPTTINDDGNPTESISFDTGRIFRLIEDERHLVAQALYHSVQGRLDQAAATQSPMNSTKDTGGKPKKLQLRSLHGRRHQKGSLKLKSSELKEHDRARQMLEANQAIIQKLEVTFCFVL